jgi:antitoxin CptB
MPLNTPALLSDLDMRRKRLLYRVWNRGMRELDLILGTFAKAHMADLAEHEVTDFENLLQIPDQIAYQWIVGLQPTPAEFETSVMQNIKAFYGREDVNSKIL